MLIGLLAGIAGAAEVFNRVAAVVDEQVITLFEVEAAADPVIGQMLQESAALSPAEKRRRMAEIKQQVLQGLIEQKLIESEIKRLGIDVTEVEIEAYIDRIKQANNYDDESLKLALARQGITMQEFRDRVRTEILRDEYVHFRLRDKVRVRDEDVQAYYTLHPDEFAAEAIVKIAEIRLNLPPDADEAQLQGVYVTMNSVYEKLLAGEDFAALARAHSQGPTAADGGVLGEFKIETELQPTYRKAVLPLSPGQHSTVYRDRNGFVILKLLEKKSGGTMPLEQVREKIGMILRKQLGDQEMKRLGEELRKKSYVDIRVNFETGN
jgi:peptidyl-prolyl cis-trans isomerase SurA